MARHSVGISAHEQLYGPSEYDACLGHSLGSLSSEHLFISIWPLSDQLNVRRIRHSNARGWFPPRAGPTS